MCRHYRAYFIHGQTVFLVLKNTASLDFLDSKFSKKALSLKFQVLPAAKPTGHGTVRGFIWENFGE